MSRYVITKYLMVLSVALLLGACKSIPEWDVAMIENPVEDGHCPDLSGRFNYDHLGAKDTSEFESILGNDLRAAEWQYQDRQETYLYSPAPSE